MTTRIFAPAPPTNAQLHESFWLGVRTAAELWPVTNFDAEFAVVAERRKDVPVCGVLDLFFAGAVDCLEAMRQVQRVRVTA